MKNLFLEFSSSTSSVLIIYIYTHENTIIVKKQIYFHKKKIKERNLSISSWCFCYYNFLLFVILCLPGYGRPDNNVVLLLNIYDALFFFILYFISSNSFVMETAAAAVLLLFLERYLMIHFPFRYGLVVITSATSPSQEIRLWRFYSSGTRLPIDQPRAITNIS